jgi:hypothetical protein
MRFFQGLIAAIFDCPESESSVIPRSDFCFVQISTGAQLIFAARFLN